MKTLHYFLTSLLLFCVLLIGPATAQEAQNQPASLDTAKIDQLTGMKGSFDPSKSVFKVMAPRADLKVTVADVHMTPPMGLTSWAGFMKSGAVTMVMGDMVLLEDQVAPVMDAALDNGLEVTALHNHFLWDNPRIMFMHIAGNGDQELFATAVGKVFAKIKETAGGKHVVPRLKIDAAKSKLAADKIDTILGVKGEVSNGIYKASWGRITHMHDATVGGGMGVNTWAAFAGSDDKSVVDGDFVVHEDELQPVLKALRAANIHVMAIHQHMIGEQPRMIFLHYWGQGSTIDLANGIKTALDNMKE